MGIGNRQAFHSGAFRRSYTGHRILNHQAAPWLSPQLFSSQKEGSSVTNPTYIVNPARCYHVGIVNVAMMDGSVRPYNDTIDLNVWQALSTRAGNEPVSAGSN